MSKRQIGIKAFILLALISLSYGQIINSFQICLVAKCGVQQFTNDYPADLMNCFTGKSSCQDFIGGLFNMCDTNNCIAACNSSFSPSMQKCNQKCIDDNMSFIQDSCNEQAQEMDSQRKNLARTNKGNDLSEGDDEGSESLWIAFYCLMGLVIGIVIVFIICCYIKRKQQLEKNRTASVSTQQLQQLPNSQLQTRSPSIQPNQQQDIALGYPTPDLPFENNYFAAEYKLTGQTSSSQTQIASGLKKQNSIPIPDHMQKYLPFQGIPIQNAIVVDERTANLQQKPEVQIFQAEKIEQAESIKNEPQAEQDDLAIVPIAFDEEEDE